MKKKAGLIVSSIVVLIAIIFYSFIDKKIAVYDEKIPTEEYILCDTITNENTFEQKFISNVESIKAINIKCVVGNESSDEKLEYALFDENENRIASNQISVSQIKSGKFNNLNFKEINGCKGKEYTFRLKCKGIGEGISIYKIADTEDKTQLKENNKVVTGTIVMRTVSHVFDWETFVVVICFVVYIVFFVRMLYKFFT